MKCIKILLLVILLNPIFLAFAEDNSLVNESSVENTEETEMSFNPGLVFTSSNILFDLDSYENGVGAKFLFSDFALRASIGGLFENSSKKTIVNGSFAVEVPVLHGRVTPYWGGIISVGYEVEQSTNGDDWIKTSVIDGRLGGLLGAEFFLLEYLSIFAEYELSLGLSGSKLSENNGGVLTETSAVNWQISSGLGNNTSIGVILYIQPVYNQNKENK